MSTASRYEDDRRRIRWINPELQRLQDQIDRALPNKVNLILGRSDDGMRILLSSTAADDPGTYYVFDRSSRRIEAFAQPYSISPTHRFAPVRPISFRGRDGTEIPGYLTLPPGRDGARASARPDAAWRPVRARQLGFRSLGPVPGQPRLCRSPGQFPRLDRLWPRLCRARHRPMGHRHDRRHRGWRGLARP